MSQKCTAIFYRDCYYLLPKQYASVESFLDSMDFPARVRLEVLTENHEIKDAYVQKGVCIAPYFYSEYGYAEFDLTIENASEVFPVEIELLTQTEYNERLRHVITEYCPGCLRYKPLSNRVQSLNGHFEEIALNSVCFYRQNTKPAPRVFRDNLFYLGGFWHHFDPVGRDVTDILEDIRGKTYVKYFSARREEDDPASLIVPDQEDFFLQALTQTIANYVDRALDHTQFRLRCERECRIGLDQIERQLDEKNRAVFQKNCKKFGVALAELMCDSSYSPQIMNSLQVLCDSFYAVILTNERGKISLLLLDECGFLKGLHYRAPLFEAASAQIRVYDQVGERSHRISFSMERV